MNSYRKSKSSQLETPDQAQVLIKDCGVYKFEKSSRQRESTSAVDAFDFEPKDFLDSRRNR